MNCYFMLFNNYIGIFFIAKIYPDLLSIAMYTLLYLPFPLIGPIIKLSNNSFVFYLFYSWIF
jgi:hypothetical protein